MDETATILHADLDAFFASVEQRDDPRLRGRPVIVGGGVVLAASYEAKAFGVQTAMGGVRARRLCPHAVVVPPRMSAYSDASGILVRVARITSATRPGSAIATSSLDAYVLAKDRRSAAGASPAACTHARGASDSQLQRHVRRCSRCSLETAES